jgi:hypothetical protein
MARQAAVRSFVQRDFLLITLILEQEPSRIVI